MKGPPLGMGVRCLGQGQGQNKSMSSWNLTVFKLDGILVMLLLARVSESTKCKVEFHTLRPVHHNKNRKGWTLCSGDDINIIGEYCENALV